MQFTRFVFIHWREACVYHLKMVSFHPRNNYNKLVLFPFIIAYYNMYWAFLGSGMKQKKKKEKKRGSVEFASVIYKQQQKKPTETIITSKAYISSKLYKNKQKNKNVPTSIRSLLQPTYKTRSNQANTYSLFSASHITLHISQHDWKTF